MIDAATGTVTLFQGVVGLVLRLTKRFFLIIGLVAKKKAHTEAISPIDDIVAGQGIGNCLASSQLF